MDKKEQILHYHRIDGLSQRDIARRVGVSRKTVKRYITEYEAMMMSNPEEGIDMCLASRPKYPSRNTGPVKLTEAVCAEIEYWPSWSHTVIFSTMYMVCHIRWCMIT